MQKLFCVLCLFCPLIILAQTDTPYKGIRWVQDISWDQVKQIAKKENRLIFVDAYATWCIPCKKMDSDVYSAEVVGSKINSSFISVKVQMDSTILDNKFVKKWYSDAKKIQQQFGVSSLPAFLFFSSDGRLIQSDFGFKNVNEFVQVIEKLLSRKSDPYNMLEQYKRGEIKYSDLPELIKLLKNVKKDSIATVITNDYLYSYLYKQPAKLWYDKQNLELLLLYTNTSKDPAFSIFYYNGRKVDLVLGRPGASDRVVDRIIYNEIIKKSITGIDKPNWDDLFQQIARKYDKYYAERNIIQAKLNWHRKLQDWKNVAKLEVKRIENAGLEVTGISYAFTNNTVYNYIFKYCDDKEDLEKALVWMKIIFDAHPDDFAVLDTYANLLYALGNREEAIKLEEDAFEMSKGDSEIKENLNKMKRGEKTW